MQSFPQFDSLPSKGSENSPNCLFSLSLQQLEELTERLSLERYRSRQIWHALYQQRVSSIEEMTSLPQSVRDRLTRSGFQIGLPQIAKTFLSSDGTERYLIACPDGETVETVWMPNGDDGEMGDGSDAASEEADASIPFIEAKAENPIPYRRATICISSQVGCAVNCQFCLTAKLGVKRNLTPGEIAGQVAAVLNRHQVQVGQRSHQPGFYGDG